VLTDAQIAQNYNTEKTNYHYNAANAYQPKASTTLAKAPVHRYTFDNMANGNDGTVIPDLAGTGANQANGVIRGLGAIVSNTGIDLPGGDSHTQAYLDFPNGIVSGTYNGAPATRAPVTRRGSRFRATRIGRASWISAPTRPGNSPSPEGTSMAQIT
jgi:hypothetical protein